MAYYVSFTAPSNKLNDKSLSDSIWYNYSYLPAGAVGYDFAYVLVLCLCEGDWFEEM